MDSTLTPLLGERARVALRRFDRLPVDVVHLYGEYPECALNLDRLRSGIDVLLEPLSDFGLKVWSLFRARLDAAYFVDMRFLSTLDKAGALYVVVPVGGVGFVSVRLWRGMHSSVFEQNDGGATLRHATERLPASLRRTLRLASLVGIHHSSPYLEIPDVRWFYGREIGFRADLANDIRGAIRKKAATRFGDLWDRQLHLLARDNDHTWSMFVDLSDTSDGTLWVALREDFKDVRRLTEPQAAYEAMLVHYLEGARTPFDFRPYAESKSIW